MGLCLLVGISIDAASATLQSVFWCLCFSLVGYYLLTYLSVFSKDVKNCILSWGVFLCWLMGCTLKECKIYGLLEVCCGSFLYFITNTDFVFHLLGLMSCYCLKCQCCCSPGWQLCVWSVHTHFLQVCRLSHTDLYHTSPVKWIQSLLLLSSDLLRIKPINHASAWVLKDSARWGLWKYTNSSDESAETVYLAPWLIIYFKLNPFMSTLHNQRAWNWRSFMDLACNFKAEPPFFVHLGFVWVLGWTANVIEYQ